MTTQNTKRWYVINTSGAVVATVRGGPNAHSRARTHCNMVYASNAEEACALAAA